MKKLLLINFCNGLYGGIESFLVNAFECLNKKEFTVTFLTCGKSTYDIKRESIMALGGKIDVIPILANRNINKIRLYFALKQYLKKEKPDIVHINTGTLSLHLLASEAARIENIPQIMCHSHNFLPNTLKRKEKLKNIIKMKIFNNANIRLACSTGAANWIFPSQAVENGEVIIIPNGIDTDKFKYSDEKRIAFRKKMGFSNELLIGNIGRFQGQKNHNFMIEIMKEVIKLRPDAKLLLVGNGDLLPIIKQKVIDVNLSNQVLFLGEQNNIDTFLSAIDVFIFPSIYEGFGIAAVEAQAAGAKVIMSTTVPKETNVTGNAKYISISEINDAITWAKEICNQENKLNRLAQNNLVYDAGFDIHSSYRQMIDIYREVSQNDDYK